MSKSDQITARGQILGSIRRSHRRAQPSDSALRDIDRRLSDHPRNLIPARTAVGPEELVALFEDQVKRVDATVDHVSAPHDIAPAIATWLSENNLPSRVRRAPSPALDDAGWAAVPALEVESGRAQDSDSTSVTPCVAAIAETGTVVLQSGPETPTTLNFLPDNHVCVVRRHQIVGPYEDVWDQLRAAGTLPRAVNLVTGPSRTGDIEQKLVLGAHGPRRLHVIIVDAAT